MLNWLWQQSSLYKDMQAELIRLQNVIRSQELVESSLEAALAECRESKEDLRRMVDGFSLRSLGVRIYSTNPDPVVTERAAHSVQAPLATAREIANKATAEAKKAIRELFEQESEVAG